MNRPTSLQPSWASCLEEVDEVLAEVKQRANESRRIDDLLRIIGVARGRTLQETIELQNQYTEERKEYQALQDAYQLTMKRVNAMASQVRQLLIEGFPQTEESLDQFQALMIRYGKMEIQPDVFVLKVRGLIQRASQLVSADAGIVPGPVLQADPEPSHGADSPRKEGRSGRTPDIETSRVRIALCDQLSSELATIHAEVKKYTTVEKLKTKYPRFKLWAILSEAEQRELLDQEFRPRAYAGRLTLRSYGLTSPSTLKKDRRKLRAAGTRPTA